MKNNKLLSGVIAAALLSCGGENSTNTSRTSPSEEEKITIAEISARIRSGAENRADYREFVGREMGIFNPEVGISGSISFAKDEYNPEVYVLTMRRTWQNRVPGKKVSITERMQFYSKVENPEVLQRVEVSSLYDWVWLITDIELDRETSGNLRDFRRSEEVYKSYLKALETPTIDGRRRVAEIQDGGI